MEGLLKKAIENNQLELFKSIISTNTTDRLSSITYEYTGGRNISLVGYLIRLTKIDMLTYILNTHHINVNIEVNTDNYVTPLHYCLLKLSNVDDRYKIAEILF